MDTLAITQVVQLFETGRPASDDSPATGAAARYRNVRRRADLRIAVDIAGNDRLFDPLLSYRSRRPSIFFAYRTLHSRFSGTGVAFAPLPAEMSEAASMDSRVALTVESNHWHEVKE